MLCGDKNHGFWNVMRRREENQWQGGNKIKSHSMIYIPEHSMSYCGSRNEFQSAPDLAWYQMKDGSCICHDMAIDGSHAKRSIVEIRAAHSWTQCKEEQINFLCVWSSHLCMWVCPSKGQSIRWIFSMWFLRVSHLISSAFSLGISVCCYCVYLRMALLDISWTCSNGLLLTNIKGASTY